MKVALISLDQKWEDKPYNLNRCVELTSRAVVFGAEVVIFPEMTQTGFSMNNSQFAEISATSSSLSGFREISKKNRIWLVAGVVLQEEEKAANTLVVFSPDGDEQARYIKIHPFSFAGEDRVFSPGRLLVKAQLPEFRLGFSICYDLRFPELYSALAKDCDVLVNIANWPKRRVNHWMALLQARAIENQVYVIGVNRTGMDGNGLEYERSSVIIDANGDYLEPVITEGEIDIYHLDHQLLDTFRSGFSTRQDRVPDLYREIL